MENWLDALQRVMDFLLGQPGSPLERWLVLALSAVAAILVLAKVGSLLGIPNTGVGYAFMALAFGVVLVVAGYAAAMIYLPAWEDPAVRTALLIGIPVVASLALVVPLMCALQKGGYIAGLITWLIGVGVAAVMVLLVSSVFDAVMTGKGEAGKGKARRDEVNRFINP